MVNLSLLTKSQNKIQPNAAIIQQQTSGSHILLHLTWWFGALPIPPNKQKPGGSAPRLILIHPQIPHLICRDRAPKDVMKEIPHESLSLLTRGQLLGEQVCLIIVSADIRRPPLIPGCSLSHEVVCNTLAHLLEG